MSNLNPNSTIIDYPIPYMGVDWSVPYTEVQHPYCPMLIDFTANGESLELVGGYEYITDYTANSVLELKVPVSSTLMLVRNTFDLTQCYTVTTATGAFTAVVSAASTALAALNWNDYCDYNDRTFIYTTDGNVYSYSSGTIASAFTITRPPNAAIGSITVYRDRLVVGELKTLYYVSTVGAVSGSFSSLNLASVIGNTYITSVRSLSTSGSLAVQDYLVISCADGKLLIYTGDFPGSANWQLISVIPTSLGSGDSNLRTLVQISSDILYFDGLGCYALSVRRLLESGLAVALQENPLAKITSYLVRKFGRIYSPVYQSSTNRFYFVICPSDGDTFQDKDGITEKDFLQGLSWYNHYLFGIELSNKAISIYNAPCGEEGLGPRAYRFRNNNRFILAQGRDNELYASLQGNEMVRLFSGSTRPDDVLQDLAGVQYPTIYLPYSSLEVGNTKTCTMSKIIATSGLSNNQVDYSLYLDFDFEKKTILSGNTEFKYAAASSPIRVVLPVSGQGDYVAPCLQTRFITDFNLSRISLQFEQGGPY